MNFYGQSRVKILIFNVDNNNFADHHQADYQNCFLFGGFWYGGWGVFDILIIAMWLSSFGCQSMIDRVFVYIFISDREMIYD